MQWFWRKITLTDKHKIELGQISSNRTHWSDYEELHIHARTVKKWRDRWRANEAKLVLIDIEEKGINYTRKVLEILRDEARIGAPCKFTAEQICQIMIVSSERPEDIGLPISHWRITSLRNELIKRGIVGAPQAHQLAREGLLVKCCKTVGKMLADPPIEVATGRIISPTIGDTRT